MASILKRYHRYSRRRYHAAARSHQRLDLQGLRMVAIVTVFAAHLCHWPQGGFLGVDVFFVISGFLITGNLLRSAERHGTVQFRQFYWNRIRRIIPAATVVLILTYLAATLMFKPFRAHEVGIDALFAFIFMANWRFAIKGTDYFNADSSVSPIQHYWSLSVEEQFYFVWPAVILVISLLVLRRSWSHQRRMQLAGGVMALIVAASFSWAIYESVTWPVRAYFNTFTRIWELGVGALLAAAVGLLARIPVVLKPVLSWTGLALIVAAMAFIDEATISAPVPWVLLAVSGSALVVAAGIGGEPKYQPFLRNPVSTYLGDISYSLYLIHWPVIILLGDIMIYPTKAYYAAAITLTLGLAIASYHFIENPFRRIDSAKLRQARRSLERGRVVVRRPTQLASIGATALLVVGLLAYVQRPYQPPNVVADISVAASNDVPMGPAALPLAGGLRAELLAALRETDWPQFDPSVESAVKANVEPPDVHSCAGSKPDGPDICTWGSPTARFRAVVIGDSVALGYVGPLRTMALNSNGFFQVHSEAAYGCYFIDPAVENSDHNLVDQCAKKKPAAVDYINKTQPDMVIISHSVLPKTIAGAGITLSPKEWSQALQEFIDKFKANTKKIMIISAPPTGINISECYGRESHGPTDCMSTVSASWRETAAAEQQLADAVGGVRIDSLPWFCVDARYCPSFVGTTLTKRDVIHMTVPYGEKIWTVMQESLLASGAIPT